MSWLRVGDWIVSLGDVVAVHFDEAGPTVELYTRGDRIRERRGFSATGEEAKKLWAYFCALSTNVEGNGHGARGQALSERHRAVG